MWLRQKSLFVHLEINFPDFEISLLTLCLCGGGGECGTWVCVCENFLKMHKIGPGHKEALLGWVSIHCCILGTQPCPLSQIHGNCFRRGGSELKGGELKNEKGTDWARGKCTVASKPHFSTPHPPSSFSCPLVTALTLIKTFCSRGDPLVSRRAKSREGWLSEYEMKGKVNK